jgi:hypothetical protein
MHYLMLELGLLKLKELFTLLCDNQKVIKLTNYNISFKVQVHKILTPLC